MANQRTFNLEVSLATELRPIEEMASQIGIDEKYLYSYGPQMAKILPGSTEAQRESGRKNGRLVLVSAVNPTPTGEGKTTTSIGLTQSLVAAGKRAVVALREPSLGPVFGMKGGGCGGGGSGSHSPPRELRPHPRVVALLHLLEELTNLIDCECHPLFCCQLNHPLTGGVRVRRAEGIQLFLHLSRN